MSYKTSMIRYTLTELENLWQSSLVEATERYCSIIIEMKNNLSLGSIMFFVIFVLFVCISDAKPIDYEDVANLLPTEPQTTNDTLAAVVRDPVVQDAVQNTIGNRSLEGLVIKKKVLVMPATEPTKVVSQSEQILVVPMANLEDVRKNITETVNAKTDVDDLISTDVQFFTENGENGYINSESKDFSSYASQHDDLYEASTETFKSTRKPFLIDNIPQEIPYLMSNPSQEIMPLEHPPLKISVPIIAFLESAKISDDKIDVPIAAVLPMQDEILKIQLENSYDGVQQNVPNYDENSWSVGPNNWRLDLSSSEMGVSPSLYESSTKQIKYMNDINSENSLPAKMSHADITPLFWTSDADINYPKDPHDMEVAANMVFRPFFKYRQEVQRRSYRNPAYRRYNSYNSYPRRNYQYRL